VFVHRERVFVLKALACGLAGFLRRFCADACTVCTIVSSVVNPVIDPKDHCHKKKEERRIRFDAC